MAPVAAAMALLVLPGLAVLLAFGARRALLAAMLAPASIACIGVAGVFTSANGLHFSWWLPLALAAALSVPAALVRAVVARRRQPFDRRRPLRVARRPSRSSIWTLVAGLVAAAILVVVTVSAIPDPERISGTYDAVFHLNAVASILDSGDASSFTLYRLTHPGVDLEFYPAAWHGLVAGVAGWSGASVPVAMNVSWIVGVATVFIPGCVLLTEVASPAAHSGTARVFAALLSTSLAAFPYLLLAWGTLYPNALAYLLLPAGLALVVRFVSDGSARWALVPSLVLWLAAAVFAHPRSLIGWAAIVAVIVVLAFASYCRGQLRDTSTRRRGMLLIGGAAALVVAGVTAVSVAVLVWFDVGARPISDRLNGGPATATQDLGTSLWQAVTMSPDLPPDGSPAVPAPLSVLLVLVGIVVLVRRRRHLWLPVSFAVIALLFTLAAGSNSDLAKIATGFWYKDKYRLISLLPTLAVPLAAIGIAAVVHAVGSRASRLASIVVASVAAVAVVAGALLSLLAGGTRDSLEATFAVPEGAKHGALLDRDEERLLREVGDHVPAGERVVGNPWNGSALTWALGGRESVFPGLVGDWGADRWVVAQRLDQARVDPGVCAALDRLNAHYLFHDPELLWGGDPQAAAFAGIDRAIGTDLITEVAREGDSVLYRISACDGP